MRAMRETIDGYGGLPRAIGGFVHSVRGHPLRLFDIHHICAGPLDTGDRGHPHSNCSGQPCPDDSPLTGLKGMSPPVAIRQAIGGLICIENANGLLPGYTKRWERLARAAKAHYQRHPELEPMCWLCHRRIDVWLHHNHRLSFTLDHVIPRMLGGEDIVSNTRPAHRGCNTKRRNKQAIGVAPTIGYISPTREW